MDPILKIIADCEAALEEALVQHEQHEEPEDALDAYLAVEGKLLILDVAENQQARREQQRVLAYALLRAGNMLRQLGRMEEAAAYSEREIAAARAHAYEKLGDETSAQAEHQRQNAVEARIGE